MELNKNRVESFNEIFEISIKLNSLNSTLHMILISRYFKGFMRSTSLGKWVKITTNDY